MPGMGGAPSQKRCRTRLAPEVEGRLLGDDRLNANDRLWPPSCGFGSPAATGSFQYERSFTSRPVNVVSESVGAMKLSAANGYFRLSLPDNFSCRT